MSFGDSFRYTTAESPAKLGRAVTTSDATNFPGGICKSLYIGGAGAAVVVWEDDTTTTFSGLLAGSILPVQCKRVNATGTTATNIVALYN